jgi:hypothetical protein
MATGNDREAIAVELAKCVADAAYFTDRYGVIDDAQGLGDGSGTMPFRLWPDQVRVTWSLMTARLTIILKARQLGISWLCCAYCLWHCLFQPGKTVLLYSQGQDEANEMLRRIKALYERLPGWMTDALPPIAQDNTTLVEWQNGSRIKSLPATQKAGRSLTASLVILDEAAFLQWADALYTALKPTIDGGGQLVILSTANGLGNLFHRLWTLAESGHNAFRTIFLPWWSRPGRDRAWYAAVAAESDDPAKVKQEYPANPTEAFLASGRCRFGSDWIAAQAVHIRPGLPRADWPKPLRKLDGLTVYALPDPARTYAIGADVAEGLEHGDYSTAVVLDAVSWEEVACLHGRWEPDEFAERLMALSAVYRGAEVVVERNNHGHAVLATFKVRQFRRVARGLDGKRGWLTNLQTKPQTIDLLAGALRDALAKVRSQATLDEMQVYRVLDDGKTGAPEIYHDDRVMSWAVVLGHLALRPKRKLVMV